jgi:hypothetical protein
MPAHANALPCVFPLRLNQGFWRLWRDPLACVCVSRLHDRGPACLHRMKLLTEMYSTASDACSRCYETFDGKLCALDLMPGTRILIGGFLPDRIAYDKTLTCSSPCLCLQ